MSASKECGYEIIEGYGCGDSYLVLNVLPPELADKAFETMRDSTAWQEMYHLGGKVPRLVAVECDVEEHTNAPDLETLSTKYPGCTAKSTISPVYRHPVDAEPPSRAFTPITSEIRQHAEKAVQAVLRLQQLRKQQGTAQDGPSVASTSSEPTEEPTSVPEHPLNHGLLQWYRGGVDFISDHSDKTLDIRLDSFITNVSLGATRTLTLKSKRSTSNHSSASDPAAVAGTSNPSNSNNSSSGSGSGNGSASSKVFQKVRMPHNSMFVLGWRSNSNFTHGIKADKRMDSLKAPDEMVHDGQRISLTFRHIATFQKTLQLMQHVALDQQTSSSSFAGGSLQRGSDDAGEAAAAGTETAVYSHSGLFGQGSIFKTQAAMDRYYAMCNLGCRSGDDSGNRDAVGSDQVPPENVQALELVAAFGAENRLSGPRARDCSSTTVFNTAMAAAEDGEVFDWHKYYGGGFTVLNLYAAQSTA